MVHRWSGWPGAWCLDCGIEDPMELALADNVYDPIENTWTDPEREREVHAMAICKEPGSDRHNPYVTKEPSP